MPVLMYNSICTVFFASWNVKMIKEFIRSEITEDSTKLRRNPCPGVSAKWIPEKETSLQCKMGEMQVAGKGCATSTENTNRKQIQ